MRVVTFSRNFPVSHPRKGEPTFFREKIWAGLADSIPDFKIPDHCTDWDWYEYYNAVPKHHTIRAGNRWKVGDKFSPRVWSGKPYASKQIEFAPPIEIKKIWNVQIETSGGQIEILVPKAKDDWWLLSAGEVAQNDGLDVHDFISWFKIHPKSKAIFNGQILCWNESVEYLPLLLNQGENLQRSVASKV